MKRAFGWDHGEEYGWFMTAALAILSLALLSLVVAHLLVARYYGKLADGELRPPPPDRPYAGAALLGASIGDVPHESMASLKQDMDSRGVNLPWNKALVRLSPMSGLLWIESYFFPFNRPSDALAFCHRIANVSPRCTVLVTSSSMVSTLDNRPLTQAWLARAGIAPFTGGGAETIETKIVYVPSPPRTVVVQAPPPPAKIVYLPGKVPPPKLVYVPAKAPAPKIVYVPAKAPPPKIVYVPVPAKPVAAPPPAKPALPQQVALNTQAPLHIQPGAGSGAVSYPEQQIWLSTAYKPGDTRLVDIAAAGDVMMGSIGAGLNPDLKPGVDVATLVGDDLAGIFRHADVAFVNLEGPLYEGGQGTGKNCGQCFAFHGPTFYAGILRSFGIDVVSLANNHSGDYGEEGRASTMAALRANGIAYGGLDRDGARAGELVLPGGKKFAMVSFAPNNGTLQLNDIDKAAQLVRDLKKTHAIVMVSFHGGGEGWTYVHVNKGTEMFAGENRGNVTAFAHAVIEAGADIVIGQGPHVPRAVEIYKGHLIAYSMGNFWTYNGVQTYAVSGMAPVLEAWVAPDGSIAGFTIHSARQAGLGVPHMDPLDEAARYMLYLTKSDFPGTYALVAGHKTVASNDGS